MDFSQSLSEPGYWVWATSLLIFVAGLVYIALDTLRVISLSRGKKILASLLGFAEIVVFLLAVGRVLSDLGNLRNVLAYAAGFALGNYVGILVEEKLAMGMVIVRLVTSRDAGDLMRELESREFGVTTVAARGTTGKVRLVFTVLPRRHLEELLGLIQRLNPRAFISVEDVRSVSAGNFPRIPRFRFGPWSFAWKR
jgi:uncharacterized protein YebE (UPF0316 family)